jgi:hypothetical protein
MRKSDTAMTNEKLMTVLRGLSPLALRAVIAELMKLGPTTDASFKDGGVVRRRPSTRARSLR